MEDRTLYATILGITRPWDAFGSCILRYSSRLSPEGEVVSSLNVYPNNFENLRDCIIKDNPKFIGPVNGYDLWWMSTTTPWSPLTGSVKSAVAARFARP